MPLPSNQIGGCEPVKAPGGAGAAQMIRSRVYELTQLSPEDYRGVVVPIYATLGTAAFTGSDTYRVPTTHEFAIKQIVGHIALVGVNDETRDPPGTGAVATLGIADQSGATAALSLMNRIAMKAMNCTVDLRNSDREQKLFDNHSLSLATIVTLIGGRPIDWSETPHIVPAGETLALNVGLIQQTAALVGGNTQYGVVLIGDLIRVAKS